MPQTKTAAALSVEEHVRLDSWTLDIALGARNGVRHDGAGAWRFGSKGALCVYCDGQFHNFDAQGPTAHGRGALGLIQHLYPDVDHVGWARAWLAGHPGVGTFIPREGEPQDEFADEEARTFINALYGGAAPIEGTPAHLYITRTRRLPLCAEDAALLRWIPDYRGDEGALLYPVTDGVIQLVALFGVYVTRDGRKSPHGSGRFTIKGVRKWAEHGLFRLGVPDPEAIECEGPEKGLAARAAGARYVVVTGGVSRLGKVPLPPQTTTVVIARDSDPPGSPPDQALWRGVIRRLGQNLETRVTARPNDAAPKDAPPLKDFDDVWRYDHALVPVLLNGGTLDHGRLGETVDDAILDELSYLAPVPFDRARKPVAEILHVKLGALDDELAKCVRARIEKQDTAEDEKDGRPGEPLTFAPLDPWPAPVDGAALLNEILDALQHYVRLTKSQGVAVALGVLHGHAFDYFDIMPIFAITSAMWRSGKTRLMRLVGRTAPRKLLVSAGSAAFLTRVIELHHPNVFVDELDAVLGGDPEKAETIRALINAIFDREGATQGKCVPTENGYEPRVFSVWAPCWIAGLKAVPATIEDRAIHIQLKRKLPGDKVQRLRLKDGPEFDVFRRKAACFAIDNECALRDAEPDCPDALAEYSDRAADAWGPLFAIAEVAGGGWLERAHNAALVLTGIRDEAGADVAVTADGDDELALLTDIRTILYAVDAYAPDASALRTDKQIAVTALNTSRSLADAGQTPAKAPRVTPVIKGEQLALALRSTDLFPDRRWSEWAHGREIKSHHIVKILREYGVALKATRLAGGAGFVWGFARADLDDAFSRYVSFSSEGVFGGRKSASHPHSTENAEENAKNENLTHLSTAAAETGGDTSNSAGLQDVRRARTGSSLESDTDTLTRQKSSPESSKGQPSVDIPEGAARRRGKRVGA
jgi:Protein of unknown function (DUF3631)